MSKFIDAIQAVKVPEALDLTTDELNAIKAEAAEPFDLIHLAFQCGFMRGQSETTVTMDQFQEIRKELQKAQYVALCAAIAAGSGEEYACSPADLYPALDGLQAQLQALIVTVERKVQYERA